MVTTGLLVEQNAHMARSVADRGTFWRPACWSLKGQPGALWANEERQDCLSRGQRL